jgi:hypothetical protein
VDLGRVRQRQTDDAEAEDHFQRAIEAPESTKEIVDEPPEDILKRKN